MVGFLRQGVRRIIRNSRQRDRRRSRVTGIGGTFYGDCDAIATTVAANMMIRGIPKVVRRVRAVTPVRTGATRDSITIPGGGIGWRERFDSDYLGFVVITANTPYSIYIDMVDATNVFRFHMRVLEQRASRLYRNTYIQCVATKRAD